MIDMVNHPAHYTSDPSGVECIDIVRHRNYNIGNAIKYLWRAGLKNEEKHIEDLKKAIFYIADEINRIENKYKECEECGLYEKPRYMTEIEDGWYCNECAMEIEKEKEAENE
jgi:hypothetical protein